MTTLIHADIFFFVTTIAVILVALICVAIMIYILRILNDLHYISGVARKETDLLAEDLEEIRKKVKNGGIFAALFNMITRLFMGREKRSSDKKTKK